MKAALYIIHQSKLFSTVIKRRYNSTLDYLADAFIVFTERL